MIESRLIDNKKVRGLFASKDIICGTTIEESPITIVSKEERLKMMKLDFETIKHCFIRNDISYLCLGLRSLCNHSENSNARVELIEEKNQKLSKLTATKYIKKGDEILISYVDIDGYDNKKGFLD